MTKIPESFAAQFDLNGEYHHDCDLLLRALWALQPASDIDIDDVSVYDQDDYYDK